MRSTASLLLLAGLAVGQAGCRSARNDPGDLPVSVVRTAPVAASPDRPLPDAHSGFRAGEVGLTPSQAAGREIWYKATASNARFHTYVFQQRLGVLIDWYRVLRSAAREDRFQAWGLLNDPDCCTPGAPGCPSRSLDETYGFDWCPGDDELLRFVGREGYRDPACDFRDPPGAVASRQDACDLAFGTSAGAMGLRKFPNPRFDAERWRQLNGRAGTWEGYDRPLSADPRRLDSRRSHLLDASIEPPFLIGMSCGACHIGLDPLRPPADPAHPAWANLIGAVGNEYSRFSEIMTSGMPPDSPEWQIFAHARPGTVDTSAVPNDQVQNPGTINAILNLGRRPKFPDEAITKWRPVASCQAGADDESCWCEPGRRGKCWRRERVREAVHHTLKGGEDSIGTLEAIQRVYFNIGGCSEECWVNHLTDLRQMDPQQRNFGQTPFDIGQCRRDCPSFRAIEDRVADIASFLESKEAQAAELDVARGVSFTRQVEDLDREFGEGAVERGRAVFARDCARCHSSQAETAAGGDFAARDTKSGQRLDWMGNDRATPVSEVGTFPCRALHSNHLEGHVWAEYASDTYHQRPPDPGLPALSGGGRGYYRNVSLLSVWAHAPFMHNNAMGPEICGRPKDKANDFYRSPYVDAAGKPLGEGVAPPCLPYDPSVAGRFALFVASMESLLDPGRRVPKLSTLDHPIRIDLGPRSWDGEQEKKLVGLTLELPAGIPASFFGNLQHKALFVDLVTARTHPDALRTRLAARFGAQEAGRLTGELRQMAEDMARAPDELVSIARPRLPLIEQLYLSCTAEVENEGHRFGEDLPPADKKALIAFLATL